MGTTNSRTAPSRVAGGHERPRRRGATAGTAVLAPDEHPAAPLGHGAELGIAGPAPTSAQGHGEDRLAGDHAGQPGGAAGRREPNSAMASDATRVAHERHGRHRPALALAAAGRPRGSRSRRRRRDSGRAMPSSSALASSAHRSRWNQSAPASTSRSRSGALRSLRICVRQLDDRPAAPRTVRNPWSCPRLVAASCGRAIGELSGASRAGPGRRWRSGRAAARWCRRRRSARAGRAAGCDSRPRSTASGEPSRTLAAGPSTSSSFCEALHVELGAEHLHRRGGGRVEVCRRSRRARPPAS